MKKPFNILQPGGEGTRIKRHIDLMMTFFTVTGIAFLLLFYKSTLTLTSEQITFIFQIAVLIGAATLVIFLTILSRWLKPLIHFLDNAPNSDEFQLNKHKYLALLQPALLYPTKHIALSIACWNLAGLIVGIICYISDILMFEEVIIVCNTIFVFSIFTNMTAYKYAKQIVPPVIYRLSILEQGNLKFPKKSLHTVHEKVIIFVGAIVLFLLLFFLQLISLTSLDQRQMQLQEQGLDVVRQVTDRLDQIHSPTIAELEMLIPQVNVKGLRELCIANNDGKIVAGTISNQMKTQLNRFLLGQPDQHDLFSPQYFFKRSRNGYIVGLCCNWKDFSIGLLHYSGWYLFFIGFMSLIAFILGRQIAQDISSSLQELTDSLKKIVEGEADLSKRIIIFSSQEIVTFAILFNDFVGQLSGLIRQIQQLSEKLNHSMESIRQKSALFIQESRSQGDIIEEVNLSSDLLLNQAHEVDNLLSKVDTFSKESVVSAETGIISMKEIVDGIHSIKDTSEENASVLEYLFNKSESIQGIMTTVERIADQTRLLAFNAMIEAVSAGEYGYRFSVVAEQVRTLAEDVTQSTKDIRSIIKEILSTLTNLVKNYNNEQDDISSLAQKIVSTNAEFNKIVELSEKTSKSISKMVNETDMQRRIIKDSNETIETMISSTKNCIDAGMTLQQLIIDINLMAKSQDESTKKFKV